MEKSKILANVVNLTIDQLFNEIRTGNVTLQELIDSTFLSPDKRRKLQDLLAKVEEQEETAWQMAQQGGESGLKNYIVNNPTGKYIMQAKEMLENMVWDRAQYGTESDLNEYIENNPGGKYVMQAKKMLDDKAWSLAEFGTEDDLRAYVSKFPEGIHVAAAKAKIKEIVVKRDRIRRYILVMLEDLAQNPNSHDASEICDYIEQGFLNEEELIETGIPEDIVRGITKNVRPSLNLGETPDGIPQGYTEVYFWGIPGSGKTCALAAILGTADKLGYLDISAGPGYDYMTKLKNLFVRRNAVLPAPTPSDNTQYLPLVLKKPEEKYGRSVSLLELSGEIFRCFYVYIANQQWPSEMHKDTFEKVEKFLASSNRKIHFFFIDYGSKNEPDAEGLTQTDFLKAASTYFKNKKVFNKTTDAIYVVLTKSDLMSCGNSRAERIEEGRAYLQNDGYNSFINTLKNSCEVNRINAGKLTLEPFSLGNVYFRQICNFDPASARQIIEILMDRIQPTKTSVFDALNR